MKVSVAVLSFLILAVDLGYQVRLTDELKESMLMNHQFRQPIHEQGVYQPSECCTSYVSRNIRCLLMENYFETSSRCSRPGVIFTTKRGQHVCANPFNKHVQDCMNNLKPGLRIRI
ncbi:C-C motif chemokine 15 [Orycteropus afer afer]|uniref:C-C motif chemokine 15 n=1 Tax=Orycteropus afer afer TaxID=1230840 RepID=A0AC54Z4J7_ORYAF|nr:C-C motif chemokine 15 [Orycteropus afer afer]